MFGERGNAAHVGVDVRGGVGCCLDGDCPFGGGFPGAVVGERRICPPFGVDFRRGVAYYCPFGIGIGFPGGMVAERAKFCTFPVVFSRVCVLFHGGEDVCSGAGYLVLWLVTKEMLPIFLLILMEAWVVARRDIVRSGAGFLGLWLVKGEMLPILVWIFLGSCLLRGGDAVCSGLGSWGCV